MATAAGGDGADSNEVGGGGAGGKFRKRPFRRPHTTPYDRPPTSVRNPSRNGTGGGRSSWLSKLIVDPASKLISTGAQMFFSSVFPKRLPPPPRPPPPGLNQQSNEKLQETVSNNCGGKEESDTDGDNNAINNSDGIGISELEQLLKHKSFTRSEIERLTELLRERSFDSSTGNVDHKTEANPLRAISDSGYEDSAKTLIQENNSTPLVSSRAPDHDVAMPAELAKAYMGSRPKVSPSTLGLRSQALREDMATTTKAPTSSLALKSDFRVGIIENGFTTPRARGRSALYSMARAPYSRIHPSATPKGFGSTSIGYGGRPSSSNLALGRDEQIGTKQLALKRRSSVLDDDVGSVGPMRRIRPKPNLLSHGSLLSVHRTGITSIGIQQSSMSTQKLISTDEHQHKVSKTFGEREDNCFPSTSYTSVPSKSSEMATKILQHLEKLNPKEKSSSSKPLAAVEKSPTKLTPNMLRGQALRSLDDVDSSKLLQNIQDNHRLEDVRNIPDAGESTSSKQDNVEVNGPRQFVVPREMLSHAVNGDTTSSVKYDVPSVKIGDFVTSKSVAQPQKKRAFQMSAHEDYLDVDDDVLSNGPADVSKEKEKLLTSVVDGKALSKDSVLDKAPSLLEVKKPDSVTCDGSVIGEKIAISSSSTSYAPSIASQPAIFGHSTSKLEMESNARPLFSFSSKKDDKVPAFTFSSSTVNVSSDPNSGVWSDPKAETNSSMANIAPVASDALKIPETDKCDDRSFQKSGEVVEKMERSTGSNLASSSGIFSFAAPTNNSTSSNGPLSSSPSSFSSSASVFASSNFANQNMVTSSVVSVSVANPTASSPSDGRLAAVTAAPSLSISKSGFPSTAAAVLSTSAAESGDLNAKMGTETSSGNLMSPLSGGTSFTSEGTGCGIVKSGSSLSNVDSQSQASGVSSSTASLFNAQVAPAGSGAVGSSQSMPVQFGSYASFPALGTSGISSFTSSGTLFGTSDPATKMFSPGNALGQSSSASTSEINSISSKTGATANQFSFGLSSSASELTSNSSTSGSTNSLFASNWQSTTTPFLGSTVSSPSLSTGSSFGGFSSASAPSSTVFTFGAPSSAAAISSTGFSFGASSSGSANSSAGFVFGASSSSASATNSTPMIFASPGVSSSSLFSFTSAAATPSFAPLPPTQSIFGSSANAFGTPSGDQMNMEDSMAEDSIQSSTLTVPAFAQPPVSSPPGSFVFGSAPQPLVPVSPLAFGATQQNQGPFMGSNSGSFSLGTSGDEKSNRKTVRVSRTKNRKKGINY